MTLESDTRLEALRRSGLLEKTAVQRLEHLAFAACRLVLADVSLINAVDDILQRTIVGFPPGEWPDAHLPLENSGCRNVVLSGKPFVVADVTVDPVLCEVPWGLRFRAYLGCPIFYDKEVIGSICVLSRTPRTWKGYEVSALEGVARLAGMSLEDALPD